MYVRVPLVVVGLLMAPLSGCARSDGGEMDSATAATVTVTEMPGAATPRATDVMNASHQWAGGKDGTGIFAVGNQPRAGLSAAIPPGRYTVRVAPGAEHGHWMLCESDFCGPGFQENAAVVGNPVGQNSSTVYIGPQAHSLWVHDVVLSPIGD